MNNAQVIQYFKSLTWWEQRVLITKLNAIFVQHYWWIYLLVVVLLVSFAGLYVLYEIFCERPSQPWKQQESFQAFLYRHSILK